MKRDIEIPEVKNVHIAVAKNPEGDWSIYILNNSDSPIHDTLVVSKGYGERDGEKVKTSTLRHYLGSIGADSTAAVERIDPDLFTLNHEYWVTFYIEAKMYDKKFIFTAGSISEKNLSYIKELEMNGILHS